MRGERGSPKISADLRSRQLVKLLLLHRLFVPPVRLLINVSFALNIQPCTAANPLLLSVVAFPQFNPRKGSGKDPVGRPKVAAALFLILYENRVILPLSANRLSVLDKFKLSLCRLMMENCRGME